MLDKIKGSIKQWSRTGEEVFRSEFESRHEAASVARSEDGTYIDPAVEDEWNKDLAVFQEDIERSFLR